MQINAIPPNNVENVTIGQSNYFSIFGRHFKVKRLEKKKITACPSQMGHVSYGYLISHTAFMKVQVNAFSPYLSPISIFNTVRVKW